MSESEVTTDAAMKPSQEEDNQMVYVVASEGQEAQGTNGQTTTTVVQMEEGTTPEQAQEILLKLDPGMEETLSQVEEGSTIIILNAPEEGMQGSEDHHNLNVMAEVATAVTSAEAGLGDNAQILVSDGNNPGILTSAPSEDGQYMIATSDGSTQVLPASAVVQNDSATGPVSTVGYSASTPQLQNVKRTYPRKIVSGRPDLVESSGENYDFTDSEPTNRDGELYLTPAISVGDPEDEKFPEYIKVDDDSLTKDDLPDYVTVVGLSGKRRRFLLSDDKFWDGKLVYVRVKDSLDHS